MMGIPESDEATDLHVDQHHPGRRRPRVRRHPRGADGRTRSTCSATPRRSARTARPTPRDDLTSVMMHAEVDGERLTTQEFGSFFILLAVAGNETTRNAISHGMRALTMYPDQRKIWFDDFETHTKTAVDEIVRWATPGHPLPPHRHRGRRDQQHQDRRRRQGGHVVQLGQPRREGVGRTPTSSTCGVRCSRSRPASVPAGRTSAWAPTWPAARSPCAFDEIRRRLPNMQITGEPAWLESNFINGIKRLPCAWS